MYTSSRLISAPGSPAQTLRPPRRRTVTCLLAGSAAFSVYLGTLAPTVTSEDSGELIGAAYFFGVAHPPGYPLWTMLCGAFIRLVPFGEIAWRANLFSAVCAAAAIAGLCRVLMLVGLSHSAALAGALICAFGAVLWSQSVITEVYTLHFLIFALLVWCVLRWRRDRKDAWLYMGTLLLGLGMSNHQTIGFTGVALAAWVLIQRPKLILKHRLVAATSLAFSIGLLPHVYMYVRAYANPPINWGNTVTPKALWDHVTRRQYRSVSSVEQEGQANPMMKPKGQLGLLAKYCRQEYTPWLLALLVPGLSWLCWPGRRDLLLLWWLVVACNVLLYAITTGFGYATRVDQWTNKVFFLPVYACLAGAIACGIHAVQVLARHALQRTSLAFRNAEAVIGAIAIAPALLPLAFNVKDNDMRRYWYAYDHAHNLLNTMLPGAIVFPSGDHNTFPLLYVALVEGYRPDVTIADKYGYIDLDLYRDMPGNPGKPRSLADRERIEEWIIRHARRPVYYTAKQNPLVENARIVPAGLLYHLLPEGMALDTESCWAQYRYRNLEGQDAPRDFGADNILSDWEYFRGLRQLVLGNHDKAFAHFAEAARYGKNMREVYNNIGSALAEHGYTNEAIGYYRQAAVLDARYTAPRWNMARLYKSLGDYTNAEHMFIELSSADPKDFRVWGELGFLAVLLNRQDAVPLWEKSLALNPAQPQIIEQLYLRHFDARSTARQPISSPPSTTPNECDLSKVIGVRGDVTPASIPAHEPYW